MQTILIVIVLILVRVNIHQANKIRKLRGQTIEAFEKLCRKIFEEEN